MYKYTFPITRYQELESTLSTDTNFLFYIGKEQEIVDFFYDRALTVDDENRIRQAYLEGKLQDTFGYISQHIINKKPGKTVKYKKLMGDLCWFEGFSQIGENHWELELGS